MFDLGGLGFGFGFGWWFACGLDWCCVGFRCGWWLVWVNFAAGLFSGLWFWMGFMFWICSVG